MIYEYNLQVSCAFFFLKAAPLRTCLGWISLVVGTRDAEATGFHFVHDNFSDLF